jgi:pentatricopeptide repeat protein
VCVRVCACVCVRVCVHVCVHVCAVLRSTDASELVSALQAGDVDADIRNFNYLIRVLGAQGRFEDAVAIVDRIYAAGLQPDEATYNALLSACAEQRNQLAAWEVINVMKSRGVCRIVHRRHLFFPRVLQPAIFSQASPSPSFSPSRFNHRVRRVCACVAFVMWW